MIPTRYGIPSRSRALIQRRRLERLFGRIHWVVGLLLDDVSAWDTGVGIYTDSLSPDCAVETRTNNVHPLDASKAPDKRGTLEIPTSARPIATCRWTLSPSSGTTRPSTMPCLRAEAENDPQARPYVMNDPAYYQKPRSEASPSTARTPLFRLIHLCGRIRPTRWTRRATSTRKAMSLGEDCGCLVRSTSSPSNGDSSSSLGSGD